MPSFSACRTIATPSWEEGIVIEMERDVTVKQENKEFEEVNGWIYTH